MRGGSYVEKWVSLIPLYFLFWAIDSVALHLNFHLYAVMVASWTRSAIMY